MSPDSDGIGKKTCFELVEVPPGVPLNPERFGDWSKTYTEYCPPIAYTRLGKMMMPMPKFIMRSKKSS